MELKIKMTAHLTSEDVKKLLQTVMQQQMPGFTAKSVRFQVSNTSDDRFDNSNNYELTGVDVDMEPTPSSATSFHARMPDHL